MRHPSHFSLSAHRHQHGQALVFGIFLLLAGLVTMYYMFNTGQITQEKAKLVNTADAVAYSAGLMEARALNFDAYANRAMIANEVGIAQMVSIASWARYAEEMAPAVPDTYGDECWEPAPTYPYFGKTMLLTWALCWEMQVIGDIVENMAKEIPDVVEPFVDLTEVNKTILQAAQALVHSPQFSASRHELMDRVAEANYRNDGTVRVDPILTDNWNGFTQKYVKDGGSGDERGRLGELAKAGANNDGFVKKRSWTDMSLVACGDLSSPYHPDFNKRRGGTELLNYDEWKAMDTMSHHRVYLHRPRFGPPRCRYREDELGSGSQAATNEEQEGGSFGRSVRDNPKASREADKEEWDYSGIPEFYDLSASALREEDPRVRFTVRLTRAREQTRTTEAASQIRTGGRLAIYNADPAAGVMAALSSAEVYFDRPEARKGNPPKKELGSLFNPFWHVHLTTVNADEKRHAAALQGVEFISE